jgi:uncharacterized protein (TIGR02246 family)
MNANEQAVAAVLAEYQGALNQSDTDAVMKLYASDGVFMPQHFPSSVGADAVRKAYLAVFEAITLRVEFKIGEVLQIAPDWAIARIEARQSEANQLHNWRAPVRHNQLTNYESSCCSHVWNS